MSTLARKIVMALTGLFWCVFLVVHLGGNSLLLLPPERARYLFNAYAAILSKNPLIEVIAYALYTSMVVHILDAAWITRTNQRAAGSRYADDQRRQVSPWYARSMGLLGTIILAFLVIHMKDFWFVYTFGAVPMDADGHKDLYQIVVVAFDAGWYVVLYVAAVIALGYHLMHGVFSALRTLGLHHSRYGRWARALGILYSAIITAGFCLIAIFVHFAR